MMQAKDNKFVKDLIIGLVCVHGLSKSYSFPICLAAKENACPDSLLHSSHVPGLLGATILGLL